MLTSDASRLGAYTDRPVPAEAGSASALEPDWRSLYRAGGIAAGLLAVLMVLHAGVFAAIGLPTGVDEWFALFGRSALLGLLAFEGLMLLYVLVSIPVVLALFAALRRSNPTLMALYLAVSLTGIVLFIVARPGFEMLALSQGSAAATTDTQRAAYLAAGQSALATFQGTAFWVSYALGSVGGLLVATAMLRSHAFGRTAAYARIASSVLDWGLFLPGVGLLISLGSVLCLLIFNVLVARRLLQFAGGELHPGRTPL